MHQFLTPTSTFRAQREINRNKNKKTPSKLASHRLSAPVQFNEKNAGFFILSRLANIYAQKKEKIDIKYFYQIYDISTVLAFPSHKTMHCKKKSNCSKKKKGKNNLQIHTPKQKSKHNKNPKTKIKAPPHPTVCFHFSSILLSSALSKI